MCALFCTLPRLGLTNLLRWIDLTSRFSPNLLYKVKFIESFENQ